jgi:hypothetical protein
LLGDGGGGGAGVEEAAAGGVGRRSTWVVVSGCMTNRSRTRTRTRQTGGESGQLPLPACWPAALKRFGWSGSRSTRRGDTFGGVHANVYSWVDVDLGLV